MRETPSATDASGVIAALSSRPSRKSESATAPIEARAAPAAPDDREADHLVAPARQREPAHRRGAARGGERQDCRALPVPEEPLPAPRLGGIRREHDDRRDRHEPEVRVMQRPPREGEVARDERGDDRRDADEQRC